MKRLIRDFVYLFFPPEIEENGNPEDSEHSWSFVLFAFFGLIFVFIMLSFAMS